MKTREAAAPPTTTGEPEPPGLKAAMTAAWDNGAATYDSAWAHGLQTQVERDAWLALLERLLPVTPALRILDIGTGTGFLALLLAELGHQVTGIDLSQEMLQVAQTKAESASVAVEFITGDAESPPPLEPFDVAIARHVIWTLQRPELAVRAWTDLVHPGGRVIAIDGLWRTSGLADQALAVAGRYLTRLRQTGDHREHAYPAGAEHHLPLKQLKTLEPARNVFVRAGLHEVLAEELTWIDDVERSVMPLEERLRYRYRRYLLEGTRPHAS